MTPRGARPILLGKAQLLPRAKWLRGAEGSAGREAGVRGVGAAAGTLQWPAKGEGEGAAGASVHTRPRIGEKSGV